MSPRSTRLALALLVAAVAAAGCGGGGESTRARGGKGGKEPQTAREKQLQEAEAAGEVDGPSPKWGKWRYTGDRENCYFVVGKKCFKTEPLACQSLKCKGGEKCKASGAGPATVACAK